MWWYVLDYRQKHIWLPFFYWKTNLIFVLIDPRIPIDHKVTLHFGDNNQANDSRVVYFQSPLVKLEPLNPVTKYNSLEAFNDGE